MRVLTRSDFDGLACCALLIHAGAADGYHFVHPKDVQDGKVEVTANDILANMPYAPGCAMWFDHHTSEEERGARPASFAGASHPAPSAARVIYEYYGPKKFPGFDELIAAVDKADSARFTPEEILSPQGWVLLSFIMDPRTGLGRYHDYRIPNFTLMKNLVRYLGCMTADVILAQLDVRERVERYFEQDREFRRMLAETTRVDGNVIITDLRGRDEIFTGNRFLIYALYPEANVSIWVVDGKGRQNAVFAVGHSIINRTSKTDVGNLMLRHGGGGHRGVGTCQVDHDAADRTLRELITALKRDG